MATRSRKWTSSRFGKGIGGSRGEECAEPEDDEVESGGVAGSKGRQIVLTMTARYAAAV